MHNSKAIGQQGEYNVATVLSQLPSNFYTLNNVLLKTPKGTTQIDHVVVSPYGVFVIETKNYKGIILGDTVSQQWTQVLYTKNGQKNYSFYSPYFQNLGHINHLIKDYNLNPNCIEGIIVFSNNNVDLTYVNCNVFNLQGMYSYITSHTRMILSEADMLNIISCLHYSNIESSRNNKKHIKYVNKQRRLYG